MTDDSESLRNAAVLGAVLVLLVVFAIGVNVGLFWAGQIRSMVCR